MALVTCTVAPLLRWFSHVNNRVRFHCVFTGQHVRNHYFSTGDLLEMLPAQAHDCVSTITFLIIICSKCIKKLHVNLFIKYTRMHKWLCILHPCVFSILYLHPSVMFINVSVWAPVGLSDVSFLDQCDELLNRRDHLNKKSAVGLHTKILVRLTSSNAAAQPTSSSNFQQKVS